MSCEQTLSKSLFSETFGLVLPAQPLTLGGPFTSRSIALSTGVKLKQSIDLVFTHLKIHNKTFSTFWFSFEATEGHTAASDPLAEFCSFVTLSLIEEFIKNEKYRFWKPA